MHLKKWKGPREYGIAYHNTCQKELFNESEINNAIGHAHVTAEDFYAIDIILAGSHVSNNELI